MDVAGFYQIVSGICFALCGLWWTVVQGRKEWSSNPVLRGLAGGVYASFLIPGVMSLGAQIGGESVAFWRLTFAVAAVIGMVFTFRLLTSLREFGQPGLFARNRWLVVIMYVFVFIISLFPGLIRFTGLKAIQIEAILLSVIILLGHGLAWEMMTGFQEK
jgi:hypothetical protein